MRFNEWWQMTLPSIEDYIFEEGEIDTDIISYIRKVCRMAYAEGSVTYMEDIGDYLEADSI